VSLEKQVEVMKKDNYIDKYCRGKGIEIGGADNCIEGIDSIKVDNKDDYFGKNYTVDHILEADDLHAFKDGELDFVVTIHVLEHLTNPVKALLEWNRIVRDGGYIFTAIPKKDKMFDRYREKTPLMHLLDDFRYDVGPLDATHVIEFNQFSVPAIYLEWKNEWVPNEEVAEQITRFYRGEKEFLQSEAVYQLWRHLEAEKIRHLMEIRNGISLDIHYHVWESGADIEKLLNALMLEPVEIVEDYLGNSILFVVKVDKSNQHFSERINDLKKGVYPPWIGTEDTLLSSAQNTKPKRNLFQRLARAFPGRKG
jgi:SAM-dependent methyltransferase